MISTVKSRYSILELSYIFKLSKKRTIRYLRYFNVPIQTKERVKLYVEMRLIKDNNIDLYQSIILTLTKAVKKPFFSIQDLCPILYKTHSGTYMWIKRNKIRNCICGNRIVVLASYLSTSAPK